MPAITAPAIVAMAPRLASDKGGAAGGVGVGDTTNIAAHIGRGKYTGRR